ncbi:MAG: excinuclease ABC subunit UvrC [Acholeplasmatales bacterium]|nr:MAG: excinuclease ABC subunit UvrC [Acholeplasmatales bacterium]
MIKEKLSFVPEAPGSYQMLDEHGKVIYVGKAKNLKKRLTTYFTGSHDYKTTKMIRSIHSFEYIVTNTELEALILEIDLIKKYRPRFNVLLTDDKSYPYIEITQERHPKLRVTRPMNKTNKHLYGPYPDVRAARDTLRILNRLYPLRKCHKLPNEPCLYYYLKQCLAPCIHKVERPTYAGIEREISRFLKGETRDVVDDLKQKMFAAAETLAFERAQEYKKTIDAIETTTRKQSVNLDDLSDRDVIAIVRDEHYVAIEIFFIRSGKINARDRQIFHYYLDPEQPALDYLMQFYQAYPIPRELLTNEPALLKQLEAVFETTVKAPKRGPKRQLLDLAETNARQSLSEQAQWLKQQAEKTFGALDQLADMLNIPTPYRIEAFDNSHFAGAHPVSAMVVFTNGKPDKQAYRKYKLKHTGRQSGDTEQMKEVLYRRYHRMLLEDSIRPDLILVDGGIHQLNAAKSILADFDLTIPLAGLVKGSDHKTHHLMAADDTELELDRHGKVFALLAFIQEEAHRFAIDYHKTLRSKGVYATILDNIEGVGAMTKKKLLTHFKTIEAMRAAPLSAYKALSIPEKTAARIKAVLEEEYKNR